MRGNRNRSSFRSLSLRSVFHLRLAHASRLFDAVLIWFYVLYSERYRMKFSKVPPVLTLSVLTLAGATVLLHPAPVQSQAAPSDLLDAPNGTGISRTRTTAASFDLTNPFFAPLGTNARSCATCHPVSQGAMITSDYVERVFNESNGMDPLFSVVDGVDNPNADMSTLQARRDNTKMIRTKGLIRIGFPMPANAEFTLVSVDDPYGYSNKNDLSCFRRPLPATNLRFISTVMWDGRERPDGRGVRDALASQVRDAVLGHMQGLQAPSDAVVNQIVDFETGLYTSQIFDNNAGRLNTEDINAGPHPLFTLAFYPGINNAFGQNPSGEDFNPFVFTFFRSWLDINPNTADLQKRARLSIARGEKLFNTKKFFIKDVAGLNDLIGDPKIKATCSTCHSTPKSGGSSLPYLMNTGISDASLRTPDMPLYTLKNKKNGKLIQTTDPGIALTTGKWKDIGKFKVPSLRGVETQSPYMHNGFSGEVLDVVNFYNTRFNIGLTESEKADLKAFIQSL